MQPEDVIDMAEGAMAAVFKAVMNYEFPRPLPHMTYHEAMARFGIDRPDTRFRPRTPGHFRDSRRRPSSRCSATPSRPAAW